MTTELRNRLIAGFSGFFLMLIGILWNEWSLWFVFSVIGLMALHEFFQFAEKLEAKPLRLYAMFLSVLIWVLAVLTASGKAPDFIWFLVYPAVALVFLIKIYDKTTTNAFRDIAYTFLALLQVTLPIAFIFPLVYFSKAHYDYLNIFVLLFFLWIHDIAAYFGGKYLGKTPLFQRISPKKTWEGSFFGALATIIMLFILHNAFGEEKMPIYFWAGAACIVIVISTYGDLLMSLYKRNIDIKDSGSSIPGHGGFLDRFDGFLLIIPFIYTYFWLVRALMFFF
ncbi:MAG: phosphatidate cytidylyltransferase [Cytophagales bacterium]|nr:MAG: phosphatidate cytidylyltransferase [Cytophagales bacterium]